MKRRDALILLLVFAAASLWTAVRDYEVSRREITDDLSRALTLTALEQPDDWLSTDTIRQYRGKLLLPQLQEKAVLMFCIVGDESHDAEGGLSGRSLSILPGVSAYGRVNLSAFSVWRMGDHRLSLALSLLTLLWMALSLRLTRRSLSPVVPKLDDMMLTPMQRQLMDMFLASPSRELTKDEICAALWPRKDDPSDTLYALISRLKTVLTSQTSLRIVSHRGRSYRLVAD